MTMARLRLVCASANPDKVMEIAAILDGVVDLLPRPPEVPDVVEDADTLIGNARLKAAAICAATGLPAVSDDTGLFVDALGGAPGIYAARFAGEDATYADNRAKLLRELGDTTHRRASFVSAVMVVWPDGRELAVEGVCEGTIATTELGDRGFGYDPVFVPDDGDGRSFCADERRREEPDLPSRPGLARPAGCCMRGTEFVDRVPVAQIDRPTIDHIVPTNQPGHLVHRHRRVDVRWNQPHPLADGHRAVGTKVMCSSDRNRHRRALDRGVAVVHPLCLQSGVAHRDTRSFDEITVASTKHAWLERVAAAAVVRVHQRVAAGLYLGHLIVQVEACRCRRR